MTGITGLGRWTRFAAIGALVAIAFIAMLDPSTASGQRRRGIDGYTAYTEPTVHVTVASDTVPTYSAPVLESVQVRADDQLDFASCTTLANIGGSTLYPVAPSVGDGTT